MTPLKVLHLTSTRYGLGGVETLLLAAADKYDTARFQIAYCNLFDDKGGAGRFPTDLRERGLTYFHIPGHASVADMPGIFANLVRLLRREQFDVLHSHMLFATIFGHTAARIARTPATIIASRQYTKEAFIGKNPSIHAVERQLLRRATHLIGVSKSVREDVIREEGVSPDHISLVHNSIDLAAIDRAKLDAPVPWDESWKDSYILGFLASLFFRKGHVDLLRALVQVIEVEPRVRLVLVGDGPERAMLEALTAELGLTNHVRFAGFRGDSLALVHEFDLYVHPSHHEPFGIALVEAMAARKAVVATTVGGVPEVVADGETGVLVPPSDPTALAKAILELVRNPERAREMGERGRERARRLFSVEVTVEKYQEIYSRFAGGGSGGRRGGQS